MTSAQDHGSTPKTPAQEATEYPESHPARRQTATGKQAQTIVFLHGGNVGNWSWDPQVLAFGDFNVLTLHLPAFGARSEEKWQGLESAADDVAALIADEVSEGGVHLVGISLGGIIALHVAARHPELIESLMITGTPVASVSPAVRAMHRMQLKLIGSEWYWRFQAGAYGMVDDERELFTEHGVKLKPENLRSIMDELAPGGLPGALSGFHAPALVLAGAKEPKVVQKSFAALRESLPQVVTRVVPGMHHQWNIENPLLFNSVLRRWIADSALHQILVDPQAASPTKPTKLAKVEKPAKPVTPTKSTTPVSSATKVKPATPSKPATAAKPEVVAAKPQKAPTPPAKDKPVQGKPPTKPAPKTK